MSDFRAILARAKHRAARIDGFNGPRGPTHIKPQPNSGLTESSPGTTRKDVVVSLVPDERKPASPVTTETTGAGGVVSKVATRNTVKCQHFKSVGTTGTTETTAKQTKQQNLTVDASVETFEFEIDGAEREAIAIELGGVPVVYASTFAHLQAEPPAEVPRDRWHQFINDAGLFFDLWGRQAEALGWRADELFGLDPAASMARYDRMGLIWMLRGENVIGLTTSEARLSGGLAFYRKAAA
jgi:hypothetical protein